MIIDIFTHFLYYICIYIIEYSFFISQICCKYFLPDLHFSFDMQKFFVFLCSWAYESLFHLGFGPLIAFPYAQFIGYSRIHPHFPLVIVWLQFYIWTSDPVSSFVWCEVWTYFLSFSKWLTSLSQHHLLKSLSLPQGFKLPPLSYIRFSNVVGSISCLSDYSIALFVSSWASIAVLIVKALLCFNVW